ncbi:Protein crossbronx -like protein [Ceratocystis fimbriata CBS 114723]|uniref:Protein crossbronx-like protein n=1 Tax=Ceratocystis fimbriata CBS 114723 TaxID=1035309 RepID=A0A2C5X4Q9_9PEZI|nr:Protein crossbronx -like protein [Ceratocystis fimbriata CBS 114723]
MATLRMASLPSMRKQHLMAEFAGLKQACPDGVFVSLTPGDPSTWSGVIFVRKGPYSSAVLRFQISFPDAFPRLPPQVTFLTDMFHPLITPLSTYSNEGDTVSANDSERLPPGGFSLRHGFPSWFTRRTARRIASDGRPVIATPPRNPGSNPIRIVESESRRQRSESIFGTPASQHTSSTDRPGYTRTDKEAVPVYDVLAYIRSSFDDEEVLDSIPLEAAGNQGAWHAWRLHRKESLMASGHEPAANPDESVFSADESEPRSPVSPPPALRPKQASQWNWEGVWERRVSQNLASSLQDSMLYGGTTPSDELIHFLPLEGQELETTKENLMRALGATI